MRHEERLPEDGEKYPPYVRGDYEVTFGTAWFIMDHMTPWVLGRVIHNEITVQRKLAEARFEEEQRRERDQFWWGVV